MIKIDACHSGLIGDALSTVPWMQYLCEEHNTDAVVVGGFNRLVADVLGPSYRFTFQEEATGFFDAEYLVSVAALFGYSGQTHMCQCFFRAAGKPEPALPLTLDLRVEPCGLPPGAVIAPYSRSDWQGNKFWPHERWIAVVERLRNDGLLGTAYVLGANGTDDPAPYVAADIEPVFDRPLAQVLDLLKRAPLVLTIDTGISHLAHYGAVERHVLLYPGCLPECWVPNLRAAMVRAPNPIDIQPQQLIDLSLWMLNRGK